MKKWIMVLFILWLGILNAQSQNYFFILNNLSKTLSVYDPASNYLDENFMTVDPVPGNTSPNDFVVVNDTLYVIIGLTDMLRVFDLKTRTQVDTLSLQPTTGVTVNPNKIVAKDSLLYITAGAYNSLIIVNRKSLKVEKYIPMGIGPEHMTVLGDTLLVSASGFNYTDYSYSDPWLYFFDMRSQQKIDSMTFSYKNIGPVTVYNQDTLFVICRAELSFTYVPEGALYKVKLSTKELVDSLVFSSQRFIFSYLPEWNHLILGPWQGFDVLNANDYSDTLFTSLTGDSGFLIDQNKLYVLTFSGNAMMVYDQSYNVLDSILLGDGPMVLKKVALSQPLKTEEPIAFIADEFQLKQNYPNPFNPVTYIPFSLKSRGYVKLEIFSITGEKVATLVDGYQNSGDHLVKWDARTVPSGVYFYRISVGSVSQTRKMILVK